jgi:hypothetical protein
MRVWGMHERTQIELSAADRAELKTIVANRKKERERLLLREFPEDGPAMRNLRSCHWQVGVGVLRIHFTADRLPFSKFHSTRLFSSGLARTVR